MLFLKVMISHLVLQAEYNPNWLETCGYLFYDKDFSSGE